MMGRFKIVVKRWWVLALVLTLALSLTSCGKRRQVASNGNYGYSECSGTIGAFDIYSFPNGDGTYDLSIIPFELDAEGDVASIYLSDESFVRYRTGLSEVVLQLDDEITINRISEADLERGVLAIIPWDPQGEVLPNRQVEKDATCYIPYPGDDGSGYTDPTARAQNVQN